MGVDDQNGGAGGKGATPVTAKYLGKLAAADVFTTSNAFSVLELAVREDQGLLGPFGIQHR
jgi:hypothetical protein